MNQTKKVLDQEMDLGRIMGQGKIGTKNHQKKNKKRRSLQVDLIKSMKRNFNLSKTMSF